MSTQYKIFFIWFVLFLISVVTAMTTQTNLAINITLGLLIALGCIIVIDTSVDAYYSFASSSWPATLYKIVGSRTSYSSGGSDHSAYYSAYFEIEYNVRGKKYKLPQHDLNIPKHSSKEDAEEYIRKVCSGEYGVSVYYNPAKPDQAYVKPGLKFRHFLSIAAGLGMIVVPYLTITGEIIWK